MSDNVTLSTFPTSKISALTMLYLEKQNFTELSPEELADKYTEVYDRINQRFKDQRKGKSSNWLK